MRIGLAMAAVLLAANAARAEPPTADQIFCTELRRVVEAAPFDGGFAGLERSRAMPPRLGFTHGCQATGDARRQYWLCTQSFAPETLSRDALAARVAECLPDAVREETDLARDALFTLPHARIHIIESGGPRAHVGRVVELVVEAVAAP